MWFNQSALRQCAAIGLLLLATTASAADGHTHKSPASGGMQAPKPGEKWASDEVLRQGMDNIRQAMAASQTGIEQERLTTQEYRQLAETVDKSLAGIIKNCKLPKDADKAFHTIVLMDMNAGLQMMRTSPKVAAQRVGALGVLQALRNYGQYFQHPGWNLERPKAP